MLDQLLALAADPAHTIFERAAALSVAARTASPSPSWPDPPSDWEWQGGELVRVSPSTLPPLRQRGVRNWPDPVDEHEDEEPPMAAALPAPSPRIPPSRQKAPSPDSRAGVVYEMITSPAGASLEELVEASGLSVASIRGVVSLYARHFVVFDRQARRYLPVAAWSTATTAPTSASGDPPGLGGQCGCDSGRWPRVGVLAR